MSEIPPPQPPRPGGQQPPQPGGQPGLPDIKPPTPFNGATVYGIWGPRGIRHPGELPLMWIGVVVTLIFYTVWVFSLIGVINGLQDGTETFTPEEGTEDLANPDNPTTQFIVLLGILPIIIWVARAMMYAQQRAQGVRMSPTQFPEGYRMVVEAAAHYGLRKVPDAYVVSGSGTVNAFASGHGFRRFVVVYSDLFEVGGSVRDPDALRFVLAHEVGHLAAGHVSYIRLIFTNLFANVPILGPALSRAQEYTADNCGYGMYPNAAPGVIGVLGAGKYLNADVNIFEMADRAVTEKGLWVHLTNWLASHPVLTWRAHALMDRSRAGRLFFRPKNAAFTSPLPSGSQLSRKWPTPPQVLAMLDAAAAERPAGIGEQFGRFPGVDYAGMDTIRQIQTFPPLLSRPLNAVPGLTGEKHDGVSPTDPGGST